MSVLSLVITAVGSVLYTFGVAPVILTTSFVPKPWAVTVAMAVAVPLPLSVAVMLTTGFFT